MRYSRLWLVLSACATLGMAAPVHASVAGRRNTALGVTGLAIYELARGHTTTGLLAGAGAYYAWNRYQKAHRRSNRRSSYLAGYQQGVRRSYRTFHSSRYRYRR
jgi:hypothetical protein